MLRFRSGGIDPHCRRPVARLAAGIEGLDDEHAAATARARLGEWLRRRRIDFDRGFGCRRCQSQEFAHLRDRLGAVRAGEQAVVADAMAGLWEYVDGGAAGEPAPRHPHPPAPARAVAPLLPVPATVAAVVGLRP